MGCGGEVYIGIVSEVVCRLGGQLEGGGDGGDAVAAGHFYCSTDGAGGHDAGPGIFSEVDAGDAEIWFLGKDF